MTDICNLIRNGLRKGMLPFAGNEALYRKCLYRFLFDTVFQETFVILYQSDKIYTAEIQLTVIRNTALKLYLKELAAAADWIIIDIHAKRNHQEMIGHIQNLQEIYRSICQNVNEEFTSSWKKHDIYRKNIK